MRNPLELVSAPLGALVFWSAIAVTPATAQSPQRGAATTAQPAILGPAMLRPGTADLTCGTGPAGLGPWGADRLEQTLSLDKAQLAKLNELKTASQRAMQYLNESCPKNDPVTPTGRLQAMERRLAAMLEAVRTVEPALDDFYGVLTDEQKARLNAIEPTDNTPNEETYRDRRGRVHHHRGGHFRFRLPIPFPF
jgi:Spy/CpxP family protein refolding chaperone